MRYFSGERKKTLDSVLKYDTVKMTTPISLENRSLGILYNGEVAKIKYISRLAGEPLEKKGDIVLMPSSHSSNEYLPIHSTNYTYTSNLNLSSYLLPRISTDTYNPPSIINSSFYYNYWVFCNAVNKGVEFFSGSTEIRVHDLSGFPSSYAAKTSPFTPSGEVRGVYGNGILSGVVVGTNKIIKSNDLNAFSQGTFPVIGTNQRIIWNGTVFVVSVFVTNITYIYTSSDGTTYTQRQNLGNLGEVLLDSSDTGLICAIPKTGSIAYLSSNNGLSFTQYNLGISKTWTGVLWHSVLGKFVVCCNGTTIHLSTDGISIIYNNYFTPQVSPYPQADMLYLKYLLERIYLIAYDGYFATMYISNNGIDFQITSLSVYIYNQTPNGFYVNSPNVFLGYSVYETYRKSTLIRIAFSSTELEIFPLTPPLSGTQYFIRGT